MGSKNKSLAVAFYIIVSSIFLSTAHPAFGSIPKEVSWVRVTSYPTDNGIHGAVALDGKIYAIDNQNIFERYDPNTILG